jgi:hypothetical protein
MKNSKIWIPEKNYFVLLLPLMAHKSNGGIMGEKFVLAPGTTGLLKYIY